MPLLTEKLDLFGLSSAIRKSAFKTIAGRALPAINIASTGISALRGDVGGVAKGVGTLAGAKIGTVFAPGIGTVIGGIVGSFLGGLSSVFGSAKKHRMNLPAVKANTEALAPILGRQRVEQAAVQVPRFRYLVGAFEGVKGRGLQAADLTSSRLNTLGFSDFAKDIQKEKATSLKPASDPVDLVRKIDTLLEVTNVRENFINKVFGIVQADTAIQTRFKESSGLDFTTQFLPEFKRQADVNITKRDIIGAQQALARDEQTVRFKDIQRGGSARTRHHSAKRNIGNLETAKAGIIRNRANIKAFQKTISSTPIADISTAAKGFQSIFNPTQISTQVPTQTPSSATPPQGRGAINALRQGKERHRFLGAANIGRRNILT